MKSSGNDVKTYVGYVEGWRWWKIKLDGNLESIVFPYEWEWDEENNAADMVAASPSYYYPYGSLSFPNARQRVTLENRIGFYSYKKGYINSESVITSIVNRVNVALGKVALYGTVTIHEYGYRAAKARILDVWWPTESSFNLSPKSNNPKIRGTYRIIQRDEKWWAEFNSNGVLTYQVINRKICEGEREDNVTDW